MNWPEFEEPEFWYPPIDHHNNHPTAAYSWLNYQGHQGRLPTGMHPSQSERYAPFGTIDFNERDRDGSAGRYQPVPYGYAVDFFDDARDLEDTKEAHIWARLEGNPSYDLREPTRQSGASYGLIYPDSNTYFGGDRDPHYYQELPDDRYMSEDPSFFDNWDDRFTPGRW